MSNVFDQFDEQSNVFDKFDEVDTAFKGKASDIVTGRGAEAPETMQLPELQESGILSGEDMLTGAAVTPALLTATDPNEIAQIITTNFPNVGTTYQKAPDGSVYPVLVNNETGAATVINRPGISGLDIVQGLGLMAAYTPAGKAGSILSAGAKAGATGAAIESAQSASGGEFDEKQVAFDVLTGGLFKGAESVIGAGYRALKGKVNPEQAELLKQSRESGIDLMTSDVMPPKTFTGKTAQQISERIPVAGTGGRREVQQQMRQDAVEDLAQRYNQFSYDAVVESLKKQKNKVKSAAGNVLNKAGSQLDELGDIPLANTNEAMSSAKDSLSKPGVIKSGGAMDDLQVLMDAISEAPQTFSTLKENRTAFREIVKGFDKAERSQLGSRNKAILTSVETAMTKDLNEMAKQNLSNQDYTRWVRANKIYSDEAKKLTKTGLKNILDKGDLKPEQVKTMLFSSKPSEVKNLYKSLTQDGRSNARSAIISEVMQKLSTGRVAGLTPNTFVTEMKKLNPQIDIFFKGKEKAQLNGLIKALQSTSRAQEAAISTPTGQQLIGAATLGAAATDLGLTTLLGGTIGGLARIYESPPVRNALLRLNSSQKGSSQFEKALLEVQSALAASAQSGRRSEEGK